MDPDNASATISLKDIQHASATRRRELPGQIVECIAVVAGHQAPSFPTPPAPTPPARKKPKLRTCLEYD